MQRWHECIYMHLHMCCMCMEVIQLAFFTGIYRLWRQINRGGFFFRLPFKAFRKQKYNVVFLAFPFDNVTGLTYYISIWTRVYNCSTSGNRATSFEASIKDGHHPGFASHFYPFCSHNSRL